MSEVEGYEGRIMSVVEKVRYLTPDEYLKDEQHADVRHEYVAGQVYAIVDASRSHNRISRNLLTRTTHASASRPMRGFQFGYEGADRRCILLSRFGNHLRFLR